MKQNVVFWIGVRSNDTLLSNKHGNFEYLEYSKYTWQYWCKKNNVVFYEYNTPSNLDTGTHVVTWQRWFDIFDQLDAANISYDKIAMVDGSSMIHWNAPNMFDLVSTNLVASRALENIGWLDECIQGYNVLFNGFDFDLKRYINCGFQIFCADHKQFLVTLKEFYYNNYDKIIELQKTIKRGTDQPVYNYLLQINNIIVDNLPEPFHVTHMNRFNWFQYNWQLNEDSTPYFIKYGYIWFFSGFDRKQRAGLMSQTWELIKHNYE
jgi:hypothetical protein